MPKILVIDNYDSFTYNLVQYLGELGAQIEVVRNDQITLDEIASKNPEKIVISPGPCTPTEAGISVDVIKRFGSTIPILGVCLGHQAIGQAMGGNVIRAKNGVMHGKTSQVNHHGAGVFKGLASPLQATRYHSLIVERETLPDTLVITAETDDGVIMGLRHKEWPVEGVQFHPESVLTPEGKKMIANFMTN
jgi:anthranilate synthase/aminodeoxychorismate synthase-like glutamine amidotransferase